GRDQESEAGNESEQGQPAQPGGRRHAEEQHGQDQHRPAEEANAGDGSWSGGPADRRGLRRHEVLLALPPLLAGGWLGIGCGWWTLQVWPVAVVLHDLAPQGVVVGWFRIGTGAHGSGCGDTRDERGRLLEDLRGVI